MTPATKGVRLHDLRHTAAVLWLTNGVHFIQVAKWLGHSSYVLTLTTYADYIPEQETENPLPEPVAAAVDTNVVPLRPASAGRLSSRPATRRNVCCTGTPPPQRHRVGVLCG